MCIGIPMQVSEVAEGRALCQGRGQQRWLSTLLLGPVQTGDWVLSFLDSAREILTSERAAEVNAVLDLVEATMAPAQTGSTGGDDAFLLPSRMSAHELQRLTGV